MKWAWSGALFIPIALAVLFWFCPPDGDDAYHHTIGAVEQARAWSEGAAYPRYHRGWNGGTGTFAPTIYSPIPLFIQGGLARVVGDGQRAVGISLAAALLMAAVAVVFWSREPVAVLVVLTPYFVAGALSRSTTTEAWALAGAAAVLSLAMPGVRLTRRRGLGLAAGVFWVAGCQVGMLLQMGWLLGAAWAVSLALDWKRNGEVTAVAVRAPANVASWGLAGLAAAAVLWMPAIVDARHMAVPELVAGPLDWRHNFLPDGSELGMLLTATAVGLVGIALIVMTRGESANRMVLAAAIAVGVALSTPLSAPLWHLPKMEILQFPWRILGPSTVIAVLAVGGLRGRWRIASIVLLLMPLTLLPIRIGTGSDSVPTASTPEELAVIAFRQWGLAPVLPSATGFYAPRFHRLESLERLARQPAKVAAVDRNANGGSWRVAMSTSGSALLPIQWWPEWRITADGRELAFANQWGLVAVDLEEGTSEIHASLARSGSRTVGALLSIVGLAALLLLALRRGQDQHPAPASRSVG
jgi:hypothetical protein